MDIWVRIVLIYTKVQSGVRSAHYELQDRPFCSYGSAWPPSGAVVAATPSEGGGHELGLTKLLNRPHTEIEALLVNSGIGKGGAL